MQNGGAAAVPAVQTVDTLPATTTFVSASAPGGCTGTGPVTCSLGTIAAGGSASATIVVKTSATSGGTVVTDSATTSPGGSNGSVATQVLVPTPGTVTAFVPPGGSIDTGGNNPANVSLPNTGVGSPITITQRPTGNNFCQGPCNGTASFVSDFPGYNDATHPIHLKLTFTDSNVIAGLVDYATSTIYKVRDDATVGVPVPDCKDNPAWTSRQKCRRGRPASPAGRYSERHREPRALRRPPDDREGFGQHLQGDVRDPVPLRRRRLLEAVVVRPSGRLRPPGRERSACPASRRSRRPDHPVFRRRHWFRGRLRFGPRSPSAPNRNTARSQPGAATPRRAAMHRRRIDPDGQRDVGTSAATGSSGLVCQARVGRGCTRVVEPQEPGVERRTRTSWARVCRSSFWWMWARWVSIVRRLVPSSCAISALV